MVLLLSPDLVLVFWSNFFFKFYIGVQLINNVVLVSMYSKVIQLYIYSHLFFLKFFSHIGHYIVHTSIFKVDNQKDLLYRAGNSAQH